MTKRDIAQKLTALNLPRDEYWLVAGAAMVLHGLRQETRDIDLGCAPALADAWAAQGVPYVLMENGGRWFTLGPDVEAFEGWLYDRVEWIEGLPVISLRGLLQMKRALGREKDLADIALLEGALRAEEKRTDAS